MAVAEFPTSIMIEPTNHCNSYCALCPTGSRALRRPKGYMSEFLFQKIIDETAEYGTSITLWHYGEPFLHPKIFNMIHYAVERNLPVISSTNGYVFYNNSSINDLILSGLSKLIVSIDGPSSEINSIYRKGVDLDRVIKGMEYFYRERSKVNTNQNSLPKIVVQMIVFKHNQDEIDAVHKIAQRFDASFELKTANLNMVPDVNFESYLPDNEGYRRYFWEANNNRWQHLGNFTNSCSFVDTGMAINWDGTVNPCCYDYQADYNLGNVNQKSLADIWIGEPLENLRKQINSDRSMIPICALCGVDRPHRHLTAN